MQNKKKSLRTLGIIFFVAGIIVGTVMFVFMNWANFEANYFFGYIPPADAFLSSMKCPLLMTSSETGAVKASIINDSDREILVPVHIEISYYGAARMVSEDLSMAVGETRNLTWTVTSDDMVFGHLVMARVYEERSYTLPSRSRTCGIVMLSLPGLKGIQIFMVTLAFILVCMAVGWGLWLAGNRPFQVEGLIATRAMVIFTIIVLLCLLAGVVGWWLVGLFGLVGMVLLSFSVVGNYAQGK